MNNLDGFFQSHKHSCGQSCCPECGEQWNGGIDKYPVVECTCSKPMMIYIPPGQHIHIKCPMHGDVKIYGSNVTL